MYLGGRASLNEVAGPSSGILSGTVTRRWMSEAMTNSR
jgi:hypothetical protein